MEASGTSWRSTGTLSGLEDLREGGHVCIAFKRCYGVGLLFSGRCVMFRLLEDSVQKVREGL